MFKSIKLFSLGALFMSIIILQACSTPPRGRRIELSPGESINLPSSSLIQETRSATQIVSGTFNDRSFSVQVEVELTPGKIVVVGLGPWGKQLFSAIYSNDTITLSSFPSPVKQIPPQYILADILFAHLPTDVLKTSFSTTELRLTSTPLKRQFYFNDTLVVDIHYSTSDTWSGTIDLHNISRSYQVHIENIEYE